jgi:2-hydroxy-6-oxonona-2,4-dienedioate hydrolase
VKPLRSAWVRVAGLNLHARVAGDAAGAKPVVLVHGLGVSSRYMVPIAAELADEFAVYAVDLPGHGRSDTPALALDVPALAAALAQWMDAAGLRRPALLGNSMGCQIAAELAVRYPERVERLVLVGPTVDPRARSAMRQFARLLASSLAERPSIVAVAALDYARMGRAYFRELRHMLEHRIEDVLPRITAPALIVRGSRDHIVPRAWAEEAARLIADSSFATVDGGGHALNYSHSLELARIARPFLRKRLVF